MPKGFLSRCALFALAVMSACLAQRESPFTTRPTTLRVLVTIDSDSDKAANVTVELMDAVGLGSAMDSKTTDNDGSVIFRTSTGVHRIRITGMTIQPYEGDLEISRNETSHTERIRVRGARTGQQKGAPSSESLVSAVRMRIPATARKAFDKGTEAMRQQRWQESRTFFETAIHEYPQYDMAYNGLGTVQMQLNDVEGARQSFTKAIALNPDSAGANRSLARILLSEHKNGEALPLLLRSLTAEPDNAWALTNAANSELLLHDLNNALLYARKAHSIPHDGFASVHMVAARALEGNQQPAEALAEYRLYLQEAPSGPDAQRAETAIARLSNTTPK
jgi:tetratricopeptide (TPR) repeat protein